MQNNSVPLQLAPSGEYNINQNESLSAFLWPLHLQTNQTVILLYCSTEYNLMQPMASILLI